MVQPPLLRVLALTLLAATGMAGRASAQTVESPLVPRGALVLRLAPQATSLDEVFGDSGRIPLGSDFQGTLVGAGNIPALGPVAERFADLAGQPSSSLTLGTVQARFAGDERNLPLGLSYGIMDRLTVGVTVPLIRKRVETVFSLSPTGADVGANPQVTNGGMVTGFLTAAGSSLSEATAAVDAVCLTAGEDDPECMSGRSLLSSAGVFLDDLGDAYSEETVFPLAGSTTGAAIDGRWADLLTGLTYWGASDPGSPPLATTAVGQATFESLAVDPTWPHDGFPLETPEAVLGLGDVEVHAAVGLLEPELEPDGGAADGIQVALAVVGTARFGTGAPDSLRIVAPMDPPRGTSGFSVRAVADMILPGRFAVLGVAEAGWNGSTETTILAPDPTHLFTPGYYATRVRWTPGSLLRVRLSPRFRIAPGLSIGAGWETLRRGADEFEVLAEEGADAVPVTATVDDITFHSASLELRFSAMDRAFADRVPFPFEVLFRASKAVAGSAGAPEQTRVEAMVRFRVRNFGD